MKLGFRRPRAIAPAVQLPKSNPHAQGHPQNCLNCGTALLDAFCHRCGQSAHTHRMSFKHFLFHDFVHGVWHLDKGFPATLKKAFVNPGKEIRDYLAGKRVGWFSILTLILLLFAAINFVSSKIPDYGKPLTFENKEIESFVNHNAKWFLLTFCFVYSWASRIIFRRAGLNLSEHTVMNTFFFIGILVIFLTEALFNYWEIDIGYASPISMLLYMAYAYYGAFGRLYTFPGWLWRYVVQWGLFALFSLSLMATSAVIYGIAAGKKSTANADRAPATKEIHAPAAP